MDVEKILEQLRVERDLIDRVIVDLEALSRRGKRGRASGSDAKSKPSEMKESASES